MTMFLFNKKSMYCSYGIRKDYLEKIKFFVIIYTKEFVASHKYSFLIKETNEFFTRKDIMLWRKDIMIG